MGRVKVAAQAQAQQQTNISHTESLELVRCLLRVSIFHVSYLRGLFPEKSFKGVDMKNLDDMHIKMLLPSCDESRRLVDWVEGGVYDAIKRGYLKNLFFGISTDPEGTELLEEYIFSFKYGDGKVSMDVNALTNGEGGESKKQQRAKKGEFKQENAKTDLNTVRYQVCRLIRMLVQVCHTLDKVPAERYLFMKLTYQDHTPDEYEPPYFVPVDESGVGHFKRAPFAMAVGRVATDHHSVSLKVKSTLDSCEDEEPVDGEADGVGKGAGTVTAGHHSGGVGGARTRVTAQAQPSAGSVGSGDAGTEANTAAAATDADAVTGAMTCAVGGAAAAVADAMMPGGGGGCDDAMEDDGDGGAVTPRGGKSPAVDPAPTPASGLTGNLEASPSKLPDVTPARTEQQQTEAGDAAGAVGGAGDTDMDVDGGGPGAEAEAAGGAGADGEGDDVTEAPEAEDYQAVCEFVRGRTQVSLRQLGRQFPAMSQPALDGYLGRLTAQGLVTVVPGAKSTFRVSAAAAAAPPLPQQQQQRLKGEAQSAPPAGEDAAAAIAKRLDGLSMGPGGADGAEPGDDAAAAAKVNKCKDKGGAAGKDDLRRSRDQMTERSRGGRMESAQAAAGDEATGSGDGGAVEVAMGDGDGDGAAAAAEEPRVYINDSQQSNPERGRPTRVRKTSYVADPIGQGPASKKAKTVATAAAVGAGAGAAPGGRGSKAAAPAAAATAPPPPRSAPGAEGSAAANGDKPAGSAPRARGGSRLAGMRR